jgi:molybdopterin-dependent oxidoreductase alpha subunit
MTKWNRANWAGLAPNGIGRTKPNHYLEMARVVWRNRDQLPFAYRILTQGVCDGCALGTSGVRDYTMDGVHLCMVRLDMMRLNTAPALDVTQLEDAARLATRSAAELRELGRLPFPMLRRRGDRGFRRIGWDEAISLAAARAAATDPKRMAFYLTSRGLTNEAYYTAQKVARFFGTNHVDNSARICHAPSTVAMKRALGVAASTVSYKDWIGTDLLVLFGSNTPNNQPVTTKYLYYAKQQGTRVVVVNPYREPGLERYWVPSVAESALFGTKIADDFFQVHTGGDRAFLAGVLKHLLEQGWMNEAFISAHTHGAAELKAELSGYEWELLEAGSGASRQEMLRFARLVAEAKTAVFVWSMGLTQHAGGVANVGAIVNLALARGLIGQPKSGLVPIRGHSGVQGGAEVGCVPNLFPGFVPVNEAGAARMRELWGFAPPAERGWNAVEMIDAAHDGRLDWFYISGGNFLETLPEPEIVREAIARTPVRVHQDIVLSPQMFVEPNDLVLLLPAQTRYEQRGGGTETSTERRILFSPEIAGRRIGEARAEWEIPMAIAECAHPARAAQIHFADAQAIRDEIARVVPAYDGIQHLRKTGDQVQWGGERLCETRDAAGRIVPKFDTPDGRANFFPLAVEAAPADGRLRLSTRRGKQFNSIVHARREPLNGAFRDDVLMNPADAAARGLADGDAVVVRSEVGQLRGRCRLAPIAAGNVQVHWPEGNILIRRGVCDPECGIPDYNAWVTIERRLQVAG